MFSIEKSLHTNNKKVENIILHAKCNWKIKELSKNKLSSSRYILKEKPVGFTYEPDTEY